MNINISYSGANFINVHVIWYYCIRRDSQRILPWYQTISWKKQKIRGNSFVISYNIRINVSLWCLENIAKLRRNPFVYLTALIWFFTSSPAHFSIRLLNKLLFLCYWCSFFFKSKSHLMNRVKSLIIIHCSRKMFKTFCGYFQFQEEKNY